MKRDVVDELDAVSILEFFGDLKASCNYLTEFPPTIRLAECWRLSRRLLFKLVLRNGRIDFREALRTLRRLMQIRLLSRSPSMVSRCDDRMTSEKGWGHSS